jgi:hypothetical protein
MFIFRALLFILHLLNVDSKVKTSVKSKNTLQTSEEDQRSNHKNLVNLLKNKLQNGNTVSFLEKTKIKKRAEGDPPAATTTASDANKEVNLLTHSKRVEKM